MEKQLKIGQSPEEYILNEILNSFENREVLKSIHQSLLRPYEKNLKLDKKVRLCTIPMRYEFYNVLHDRIMILNTEF